MVLFAGDHFRSGVAWTTARRLQEATVAIGVGEAEVNDLYIFAFIQEQVLRFQISVADATPMDILDTTDHLLEELASLGLLKLLALDDVIEEFASAGVLHDKEQLT